MAAELEGIPRNASVRVGCTWDAMAALPNEDDRHRPPLMLDMIDSPRCLDLKGHGHRNMIATLDPKLFVASPPPATPDRRSSPLQVPKPSFFTPPARPNSTPFAYSRPLASPAKRPFSSSETASDTDDDVASTVSTIEDPPDAAPPAKTTFHTLPTEIHEAVLDHIFGFRVSTSSASCMAVSKPIGKRSSMLRRYARRKELSDLSLVSRRWRVLVQQRLYRHLKLRASTVSLGEAISYFAAHQYLRLYVKHVELWFPVFQRGYRPTSLSQALSMQAASPGNLSSSVYTEPVNNCTLQEAFNFLLQTFPEVRLLSLEGGERRKAPQVEYFRDPRNPWVPEVLPTLDTVKVLVIKGQWNLMRSYTDFATVMEAFPNLVEWHGSYSKPKSKSYLTLCAYIPSLPATITSLNLCLEGDYRREGAMPAFYNKVACEVHICAQLAKVLPALEHFAYTGRVCNKLFDMAALVPDDPRRTRLKSVEITVKNCCRPMDLWNDTGSGIHDMGFIDAFEKLVVSSVKSLAKFPNLHDLKIRFVDLGMFFLLCLCRSWSGVLTSIESVLPALNPYFMLQDGRCWGVWSYEIVQHMARLRPRVQFAELIESFGEVVWNRERGMMIITPEHPKKRLESIKLSNYASLVTRMAIN